MSKTALALVFAATALTLQPANAQDQPDDADQSNRALFANFLHNAVLGKFERADAYARSLLAKQPQPLEILEYADQHTNSVKTLILLVSKVEVSDSARQVLELIHLGELERRRDPQRILLNISKLGGDPQTEFNAINRLKESGEYAVPWLIAALQDSEQARLHSRIIRMLPKLGKEAVNPLVIALKMDDPQTRLFVVRALGDIGYPQALPYLLADLERGGTSPELTDEIHRAIVDILAESPAQQAMSADQAFLNLAEQYYNDVGSVRADPREAFANVWYWEEQRLQRVEVPTEIFNEIMAMRCCQEAIRLNPGFEDPIAVWLGANIRREAELGMNVESVEPDPAAPADPTKPEDFPRSAYFARAAGARYDLMVLDLAIRNREPAVALGAIAALRLIAGETNLVGDQEYQQPLAEALVFPDLVVRLKAALTMAHALPAQSFAGSGRVVPLLAEALVQTGGEFVVVVDPDPQNLNRTMDAVRGDTTTVIGESSLNAALQRVGQDIPMVTAFFLASDLADPSLSSAVSMLRSNNEYAMTPVVLLAKEGQVDLAGQIAGNDPGIAAVPAGAGRDELFETWLKVSRAVGQIKLPPDEALVLALDAAAALHRLAETRSTVFQFTQAQSALIDVLTRPEEELQVAAARVLALDGSNTAQQAIAQTALDPANSESLRVAMFDALARSAKTNGHLLPEQLTDQLIHFSINEPNLILRTAASQALGAMDLPGTKASQIIETYYRG